MKSLFISFLFTVFSVSSFAQQDYYWVGGSGDWSDFANHWATASGGAVFHTEEPTNLDNVFFDANSFTGTGQEVTFTNSPSCANMDWTGVTFSPTLSAGGQIFAIEGSITLVSTMSASFYGINFLGTGSHTIISGGHDLGRLSIYSGNYSLGDPLNAINIDFGDDGTNTAHLSTSDWTVTVSDFFSASLSSNGSTLDLGQSVIYVAEWSLNISNNDPAGSLVAGNSVINISGEFRNTSTISPLYYYVEIESDTYIIGSATMEELRFFPGVDVEIDNAVLSFNTLNSLGTSGMPVSIYSENGATFHKEAGEVNETYLILENIQATGGAIFTATQSEDRGGNDGWTITERAFYWVGDGGNWSDFANHWATSSGGTEFHTSAPNELDHVFFDENSFSSSNQTVTLDVEGDSKDFDWSYIQENHSFDAGSNRLNIYGSMHLSESLDYQFNEIRFPSDIEGLSATLMSAGANLGNVSFMNRANYTLLDDFNASDLSVSDLTVFNTDGFDVDATSSIYFDGATIDLNGSIVNTDEMTISGGTDLDAGISTIQVTDHLFSTGVFGGPEVPELNRVEVLGSAYMSGDFIIKELKIQSSNLEIDEGSTIQVETLEVTGEPYVPIVIMSTGTGAIFTSSTDQTISYANLQNIHATGGGQFIGYRSRNLGGNTGWEIQEPYYWVGGNGDWSDFANHWTTTPEGIEFHNEVPDETNDVIFNENSFDASGIVTFLNNAVCRTFDISDIDENIDWEEFNNGIRLIAHGSLLLSTQASITLTTIEMEADDLGHIIDPAGVILPTIQFDGEGSWELMGELTANILRMNESGTIITNDHNINLSTEFVAQIIRSLGDFSTNDELVLGASIIETPKWEVGGSIFLDAGTSQIKTEEFYAGGSATEGENLHYYDLELSGENGFFHGDAAFNQVEILAGSEVEFVEGSTVISNSILLNGTEADSIKLVSMAFGPGGRTTPLMEGISTFEVASGSVDGYYLNLTNIHGTGGATFHAYVSKDNGGNDGWNFLKLEQTLVFDPLPEKTFGDPDFELTAIGGASENPITYTSSDESVATISSSTISIIGAGSTTITATQLGNETYEDTSAAQELVVEKADQTIMFAPIEDYVITVDSQPIELMATISSGLKIQLEAIGPAMLSGTLLTPTSSGEVTVIASQSGDANYYAASAVTQMFNISENILGLNTDPEIVLYPNPTNHLLKINDNLGVEFSVSIIGLDGKRIRVYSGEEARDGISIRHLKVGTYIVVILAKGEPKIYSRLIVEK